ncbi:MAG: XylR N-terminal domain-containing protein [Deltaproteobacteria bacterium]|nr:XylR N-terminal domain-containing protein [Deltaproteobacteria bacterium]
MVRRKSFQGTRGTMRNPILEALEYDEERGAISFKGVRYLLIRPETLVEFQRALEERLGEEAQEILCRGGFAGGHLSTEKYRETFEYGDDEIVQFMMYMGGQIGWGKFKLEEFNPLAKRLIVKVIFSPFAAAYGKSAGPVCHFTRGVMAGMGQALFGEDVTADESHCLAKGDDFCRFLIEA